jgi:hypothetical protein
MAFLVKENKSRVGIIDSKEKSGQPTYGKADQAAFCQ